MQGTRFELPTCLLTEGSFSFNAATPRFKSVTNVRPVFGEHIVPEVPIALKGRKFR